MIDPLREVVVTLNQARAFFPKRRRGRRPDLSCLYRWTSKGCKGVVLESLQVGGTRCTSREGCARFLQRLSEVASVPTTGRTISARKLANSLAERELDLIGITRH
jgi:hypothetical protein